MEAAAEGCTCTERQSQSTTPAKQDQRPRQTLENATNAAEKTTRPKSTGLPVKYFTSVKHWTHKEPAETKQGVKKIPHSFRGRKRSMK